MNSLSEIFLRGAHPSIPGGSEQVQQSAGAVSQPVLSQSQPLPHPCASRTLLCTRGKSADGLRVKLWAPLAGAGRYAFRGWQEGTHVVAGSTPRLSRLASMPRRNSMSSRVDIKSTL